MENKNPTPPPQKPNAKKARLWMLAFFALAVVALVPVFWSTNQTIFKGEVTAPPPATAETFDGTEIENLCSSKTTATSCNSVDANRCRWNGSSCESNTILITGNNSGLDTTDLEPMRSPPVPRTVARYTITNTSPAQIKINSFAIRKIPGGSTPDADALNNDKILFIKLFDGTTMIAGPTPLTPSTGSTGTINWNISSKNITLNSGAEKTFSVQVEMGFGPNFVERKKFQFHFNGMTAVRTADTSISLGQYPPTNIVEKGPQLSTKFFPPTLKVTAVNPQIPGGNVIKGTHDMETTRIKFEATNKNVTITKLFIDREKLPGGTGANEDLSHLILKRSTDTNPIAIDEELFGQRAIFDFTSTPQTIEVNTPQIWSIITNVSDSAGSGNSFSLSLNAQSSIFLLDSAGSGTVLDSTTVFPIPANSFTVVDIPILTITPATDEPTGGNIIIGSNNVTLEKMVFAATGEIPVKINLIAFKLDPTSTIQNSEFTRITFQNSSGDILAEATPTIDSGTIGFQFNKTGMPVFEINPAAPSSYSVVADIPQSATTGRIFKFNIIGEDKWNISRNPEATTIAAGNIPFFGNTFTIVPVPPKPDLQIESLQIAPPNPKPGESITFTGTVKNMGGGQAGVSKTKLGLKAWDYVDNVWITLEIPVLEKDTMALAQNTTQTFTWQLSEALGTVPLSENRYQFVVCADSNPASPGAVDEADENETSNCKSQEFEVRMPRLYVIAAPPPGQITTLPPEPDAASSWTKLIQMDIRLQNGDPATSKIKKITLNFSGDDLGLLSKITEFRVYDSTDAQIPVAGSGAPIKKITSDNSNGTVVIEFNTTTPNISLATRQILTLRAKVNTGRRFAGKKFKYTVKAVEVVPEAANRIFTAPPPLPEGPEFQIAAPTPLNCPTGQTETPEGVCACPVNTFQYSGDEPTKYSPNVCLACRASKLKNIKGVLYCPGDEPAPETCPAGQTGTPPNCKAPTLPPETCPAGQTGTPPDCITPPPPPGPPPTTGFVACEAVSKFTYYGPTKAGVRETGMCIDCPTETYIKLGGKCEKEKKIEKKGGTENAGDSGKKGGTQTGGGQDSKTGDGIQPGDGQIGGTPDTGKRPVADDDSDLALDDAQKIVKAPERSQTGPGIGIYIGIVALTQALYWFRKKID